MKRTICTCLICLILATFLPLAAAASDEPGEASIAALWTEENENAAPAPDEETEAAFTEAVAMTEEPEEPEYAPEAAPDEAPDEAPYAWDEEVFFADESAQALWEESVPEAPVAEDVTEDGLVAADEPDPADDPLDPANAWARPRLDGYSYGSTYDAFVTRELDNETLVYGIDVSSWQGTINWTKVAGAGVDFVFIRAAYRGTASGTLNTDGRFLDYINGAKAAGLLVGAYIFSQAVTAEEAVEEAEYLLELVRDYEIDLPLVFDLEHYSGGRFSNADLSKREVTDLCLAFCERIERAGYQSMVYANPSMLNHDMFPEELGRLWLANYTKQTSYTGRHYEYWQCSDIGDIDGISGYVDLDIWFRPNEKSADPFRDVKPEDWYYHVVMQAYRAGIVNGMTAARFAPSERATRGQVVTMLYRMDGSPSYQKEAGFRDLRYEYYKDAVNWAAEKGLVTGFSASEFRPERLITREELVTIMYRRAGTPPVSGDLARFTDEEQVQSWAWEAMLWAVNNGIVTGYGDDTLRPGGNATRAEVCAILTRCAALSDPVPASDPTETADNGQTGKTDDGRDGESDTDKTETVDNGQAEKSDDNANQKPDDAGTESVESGRAEAAENAGTGTAA